VFRKPNLILVSWLCFGMSVKCIAQPFEPKHTVNLELGLPNGFSNSAFKSVMHGLVSFAPYYQFDFLNQMAIGGGFRYSYFSVDKFKLSTPVSGGMHTAGAFLKFGWEKFHSDHLATDIGVKIGYSRNYFDTDRNDSLGVNPLKISCFYTEPTLGLILRVDEQNSYRFFLSYGLSGFSFNPSMIGLQSLGGFDPGSFNKVTGAIIFGFGYTYDVKKK
jgi:hypothetical protein